MALILFANNAASTLAGPITNTATTANLASGTGVLFPSPSGGNYFTLTFVDAATGLTNEIVYVTNVTGDTVTMTRAQESTTGKPWLAGDLAINMVTAGTMTAMVQQASLAPTRVVTASGAFATTTNDANGYVGLNRLSSPAASSTTLPTGAIAGQTYTVQDLANNFFPFNVTVTYPAGHTGPGGSLTQVLNVNGQSGTFLYYGTNQWGFRP